MLLLIPSRHTTLSTYNKGQIFYFDKIICNKSNVNFKDLTLTFTNPIPIFYRKAIIFHIGLITGD